MSEEKAKISVFGKVPEDAIVVPDFPIPAKNNCQAGKWIIGDEEYGSKLAMTILKFSKFFGDLGQAKQTLWGQIWFVVTFLSITYQEKSNKRKYPYSIEYWRRTNEVESDESARESELRETVDGDSIDFIFQFLEKMVS